MTLFPYIVLLVLSFLAIVSLAADLPTDLTGFPTCAQKCISDNHGKCALLDMPCMCTNQVPTIFGCMQGACNAQDQATTLNFAQELCSQANSTLESRPTSTSTSETSGPARTSATTLTKGVSAPTHTESADGGTGAPAAKPTENTAEAGMSTGAKAGIGAGAALGVAAVAAGAVFVWWQRRKRSLKVKELAVVQVREMEGEPRYASLPPAYVQKEVHHEVHGVTARWTELEAEETRQYMR